MSAPVEGSNATSRSLIARVRAHDAKAWERLVELYAPYVLVECRRARLEPADLADVFQEVFQAAFTRIATFEHRTQRDTFRGWLRVIARRKVADHFRRLEREPRGAGGTEIQIRLGRLRAPEPPEEASAGACPADPAGARLLRDALAGIRSEFQNRTWQAFLGTALDGRSPGDVGEELGMSPGAVRVAKSRVLSRLRAELGD